MRRLVVLCSLVLMGVTGLAGPAQADSVTKRDARGEVPTRIDITSVTLKNGPRFASARIKVADLREVGRAELIITVAGGATDVAYVAKLAKQVDGSIRKGLVIRGNEGDTARSCAVKGRWAQDADFVRVSVPQSCVPDAGRTHYMSADMVLLSDQDRDFGPVVRYLKQG